MDGGGFTELGFFFLPEIGNLVEYRLTFDVINLNCQTLTLPGTYWHGMQANIPSRDVTQ